MAPNSNIQWPPSTLLTKPPDGPQSQYRWPPAGLILNLRCGNPAFTSDAVRRRLGKVGSLGLDSILFQSRDGTPLTKANVRRQLRLVLEGGGINGVTPHMFRRTVATSVNTNAGVELAAELLGPDTWVTVMHYVQRSELVNPATAGPLDRAIAKDEE